MFLGSPIKGSKCEGKILAHRKNKPGLIAILYITNSNEEYFIGRQPLRPVYTVRFVGPIYQPDGVGAQTLRVFWRPMSDRSLNIEQDFEVAEPCKCDDFWHDAVVAKLSTFYVPKARRRATFGSG